MTDYLQEDKESSHKEDDIHQYLSDIRVFPRLSQEEERELAYRCAQGDEDAIRKMVNSNLRLVVSVAKEYSGRGVALLDLIQEGSIGLLAAARKYDYTLDFRFSTYATKWIRQGVTKCLLNHGNIIRVPLHTAERIRKVELAKTELLQEYGRIPTNAEIARRTGFSSEKVEEYLKIAPNVCSLDGPAGEDDGSTLGELLENLEALQPQETLVRQELEQTLRQLLSTLTDRQQEVLRLHFGIEDGNVYSLEEIGKRLGISKERARQIERQAFARLQELGASMGLEDFLNE